MRIAAKGALPSIVAHAPIALTESSRLVVVKDVERVVERAARAAEVFRGPAFQLEAPSDIEFVLEFRTKTFTQNINI